MINSMILAEKCNKIHRGVMLLIDTHLTLLGYPVKAEKFNEKGKPTEFYNLNEYQAKALILLMQNSKTVTQYKMQILDNTFDYSEFKNYSCRGYITHVCIYKHFDGTYFTCINKNPKGANLFYCSPGYVNGTSVECSTRYRFDLGHSFKADTLKLGEIIKYIESKGAIK